MIVISSFPSLPQRMNHCACDGSSTPPLESNNFDHHQNSHVKHFITGVKHQILKEFYYSVLYVLLEVCRGAQDEFAIPLLGGVDVTMATDENTSYGFVQV